MIESIINILSFSKWLWFEYDWIGTQKIGECKWITIDCQRLPITPNIKRLHFNWLPNPSHIIRLHVLGLLPLLPILHIRLAPVRLPKRLIQIVLLIQLEELHLLGLGARSVASTATDRHRLGQRLFRVLVSGGCLDPLFDWPRRVELRWTLVWQRWVIAIEEKKIDYQTHIYYMGSDCGFEAL